MSTSEQFVLEVEWDRPGLPRLIGPFASKVEAQKWAALNIPNGSWNTSPLAYPYAKAQP